MLTRKEAIKRLEDIPLKGRTQVFLEKCGGWEDSRSPEEIIEEIYSSRSSSQ